MGSRYLLIVIDFPERPKKSQLKRYADETQSFASRPVAMSKPSTPSFASIL